LNVELYYIPAGATDQLQPLDRVIFGALRSPARRLFRCGVETNGGLRSPKTEAVEDMTQIWEELTKDIVREGWDFGEEWEVK
jgi:hypothetical protein